jgi:hypothetical protein
VSASGLIGLGRAYGVLRQAPGAASEDSNAEPSKPNVPNDFNDPNVPHEDADMRCRDCGKLSGGRVRCPTCRERWLRGGAA